MLKSLLIFALSVALSQWQPANADCATRLPREFRGAWVATVTNIDWPSTRTLSTADQQRELLNIVNVAEQMNLNAIVFQIRPCGDAFYASTIEPWSYWLTGQQGKAPSPAYDPLQYLIQEAHQRNIEVHAWFNPYRAAIISSGYTPASNHMSVQYPQYTYTYGNYKWMDPGAQVVADRALAVILDVVRRYDVDGVHMDDYFYPYPVTGVSFPDDATYLAYQQGGGKMVRADWRRDNINRLIQSIKQQVALVKPYVKFGLSPFGIWRPNNPPGISGLDTYAELYTDSRMWLQQGWVDYWTPQIYWKIDPPAQSFSALLQWWTQQNPTKRHIMAGTAVYKMVTANGDWDVNEIVRQIDVSRQYSSSQSVGLIHFSFKYFTQNLKSIKTTLQAGSYKSKVLVPIMTWLSGAAVPSTFRVTTASTTVSWSNNDFTNIRSVIIIKPSTCEIQSIFGSLTKSTILSPGTYEVAAVGRLGDVSQIATITVSSARAEDVETKTIDFKSVFDAAKAPIGL